jgi:hypothetical protein
MKHLAMRLGLGVALAAPLWIDEAKSAPQFTPVDKAEVPQMSDFEGQSNSEPGLAPSQNNLLVVKPEPNQGMTEPAKPKPKPVRGLTQEQKAELEKREKDKTWLADTLESQEVLAAEKKKKEEAAKASGKNEREPRKGTLWGIDNPTYEINKPLVPKTNASKSWEFKPLVSPFSSLAVKPEDQEQEQGSALSPSLIKPSLALGTQGFSPRDSSLKRPQPGTLPWGRAGGLMVSGQKKEDSHDIHERGLIPESAYDLMKREREFLKGPQAPMVPRLTLAGAPAPVLEPNVPRLMVAPPPARPPAVMVNRHKSGIKDPAAFLDR